MRGQTTWVSIADVNADTSDRLVAGITHEGALLLMAAAVEIAEREAAQNARRSVGLQLRFGDEDEVMDAGEFVALVRSAQPRCIRRAA